MRTRLFALCLGLFLLTTLRPASADPTYVRFNTNLGNIDVQLLTNAAPNTVANFMSYVNSGAYTNSIIHRSVPNFVIQGGGYYLANNTLNAVTANAAVASEAPVPPPVPQNIRGTLAMALSNGPDSATNEWFFNLVDNSASLDDTSDGGPFTVFGTVANTTSLSVMDQIASEGVWDASSMFGSAFTDLPLINYNSTLGLLAQNLVTINSITLLTVQDFPAWQTAKFTTPQQNTPGFTASTTIPWNDGIPNLLKYLCDINPSVPMSAADRAKLPTAGTTKIGTTRYMTLTYHQNTALVGVTVNVLTSPDLQVWTTVTNPIFAQIGTDSSNDPIMQVQVPITGTKQFIRLNVTQP